MNGEVTVLYEPARHSLDELAELAREPLEAAGAERAIAFGSYARGTGDGYSDLDLVVVLPTDRRGPDRGAMLAALYDALPVPLDLVVYTPEEFARGRKRGLGIFDAIAREGVTIFERSAD